MKLKLIMMLLALTPSVTLADEANMEVSKFPASQVSSDQDRGNGEISAIVGRIVFVKKRPATKFKVNTSHEQELVVLKLHGVDPNISQQCNRTYYLETIYSRYSSESQSKVEEMQKLGSSWVELSEVKIVNQGEKYATCSFGQLKSVPEPK